MNEICFNNFLIEKWKGIVCIIDIFFSFQIIYFVYEVEALSH